MHGHPGATAPSPRALERPRPSRRDWLRGLLLVVVGLALLEGCRIVSYWLPVSRLDPVVRPTSRGETVKALAFSPDGSLLAAQGLDGSVRLWEVATRRIVAVLPGPSGAGRAIAWSSDGTTLAVVGGESDILLWDIPSRSLRATIGAAHTERITAMSFRPDSLELGSASSQGGIKIWDTNSLSLVKQRENTLFPIFEGAWSPDGETLAIAEAGGGTVDFWEYAENHLERKTIHENNVWSVDWSADGQQIASGGYDMTVRVWQAADGAEVARFEVPRFQPKTVRWSADGAWVLASGGLGVIRVWDVASQRAVLTFRAHDMSDALLAVQPGGELIATASGRCDLKLWRIRGNRRSLEAQLQAACPEEMR